MLFAKKLYVHKKHQKYDLCFTGSQPVCRFFKTFTYATNQMAIEGKVKGVNYTGASTVGVP